MRSFAGLKFDEASPQISDALRILVTLRFAGEADYSILLSSDGLVEDLAENSLVDEQSFIGAKNLNEIWLDSSSPEFDAVQLPGQQRLLIGQIPQNLVIDIVTWQATTPTTVVVRNVTNRVRIISTEQGLQAFSAKVIEEDKTETETEIEILTNEIESPEVEITEIVEAEEPIEVKESIDIDQPQPVQEVAGNPEKSDPEPESTKSDAMAQYQVAKAKKRRRRKIFKIAQRVASAVATVLVFFLGAVAVTPLGLVHPAAPENASNNLVLIWSQNGYAVGDQVIVIDQSLGLVEAKVENPSSTMVGVINETGSYTLDIGQVQGKVIFKIPGLGAFF